MPMLTTGMWECILRPCRGFLRLWVVRLAARLRASSCGARIAAFGRDNEGWSFPRSFYTCGSRRTEFFARSLWTYPDCTPLLGSRKAHYDAGLWLNQASRTKRPTLGRFGSIQSLLGSCLPKGSIWSSPSSIFSDCRRGFLDGLLLRWALVGFGITVEKLRLQ